MLIVIICSVASALIYLLMAFVFVFLPVKRVQPEGGLDFDAIAQNDFSVTSINEQYYKARDNNKLFYRYILGSSAETIVLLHGSGTEGRYLIPLAIKLNTELNITVIIPDLRGHGYSQGSTPGDINYLGQLEHDLEDLLSHIHSSYANAKVILAGHSSGGGLAVKYGGNNLNQFDGTILLAPYLGYQAPTVRPNSGGWVQVAKLRYAGLAMLNNIGITFLNNSQVLFFNRPRKVASELQLESYSYQLNESFSPQSYASDLSNYKNPMLLLVGELDEAFYPNEFKKVLEINAPHAEFHLVKNTKHLNLPLSEEAAKLMQLWIIKSYDN
ncbi:MAG: alpha/beta hydrolase [Colwellia sp.]|nr:alpha/beta hydrolase [Colwellia sp.]